MKEDRTDVLETPAEKNRKLGTPGVKGRKYHGSPNLKLKKVKADPRAKIRQVLREALPNLKASQETEQV